MHRMPDILFDSLRFRNLTVKNRIFRSNISGRFDNYDGSGNQARINWEVEVRARAASARSSRRSCRCRFAAGSCRTTRRSISDERDSVLAEGRRGRAPSTTASTSCSSVTAAASATSPGIEYPTGLSSTDKR